MMEVYAYATSSGAINFALSVPHEGVQLAVGAEDRVRRMVRAAAARSCGGELRVPGFDAALETGGNPAACVAALRMRLAEIACDADLLAAAGEWGSLVHAYAWRNGRIEFGALVPKGAIEIMFGFYSDVLDIVSAVARHARTSKVLLVPGIPEAGDDDAKAGDALEAFIEMCAVRSAARAAEIAADADLMDAEGGDHG